MYNEYRELEKRNNKQNAMRLISIGVGMIFIGMALLLFFGDTVGIPTNPFSITLPMFIYVVVSPLLAVIAFGYCILKSWGDLSRTFGPNSVRICPICGSSIPANAIFCPFCGENITERERRSYDF